MLTMGMINTLWNMALATKMPTKARNNSATCRAQSGASRFCHSRQAASDQLPTTATNSPSPSAPVSTSRAKKALCWM